MSLNINLFITNEVNESTVDTEVSWVIKQGYKIMWNMRTKWMSKRQTGKGDPEGLFSWGKKGWNHSKQNDCSHSGLTSHQSQSIWISLLGYGCIFTYTGLENTSKATGSICKHLQMHTFARHIESLSIAILNSVVYIYQCKITALMHLYAPGHARVHTHTHTYTHTHTHTHSAQLSLICSSIYSLLSYRME